MQTKATFPNLSLPRLVKMLTTMRRMKRPLKHPGPTLASQQTVVATINVIVPSRAQQLRLLKRYEGQRND